jgi:hypothetical protein
MVASVMPMQSSEFAPTVAPLEACSHEQAAYAGLLAQWAALKAKLNGPAVPAAAKKQ